MTKDMSETSGVGAALYTLESLRLSGRTGGMISYIDHLTGDVPVMTGYPVHPEFR